MNNKFDIKVFLSGFFRKLSVGCIVGIYWGPIGHSITSCSGIWKSNILNFGRIRRKLIEKTLKNHSVLLDFMAR